MQTNPTTEALRSARAFMIEHHIEAIRLRGSCGEFNGARGFGFLSYEETIRLGNSCYELGELLVAKSGDLLETPDFVLERMARVEGFISEVIQPVKLAIIQTYETGQNLSHSRFRILNN
jgi:hypothetical protein